MLVSKNKQFLFVHIPKTGGTSMVSILKKYSNRPNIILRSIGYFFDDRGYKLPEYLYPLTGYPYHIKANDLYRLWEKERFKNLYKFAFVRNPYDLVISEYFYIKRIKSHQYYKTVNSFSGFEEYLIWKKNNYLRPQTSWIKNDEGEIIVDFIGRFENYNDDANRILEKLKISEKVPHLNKTKKKHYMEYYTNQNLIDEVTELYYDDFLTFKYKML